MVKITVTTALHWGVTTARFGPCPIAGIYTYRAGRRQPVAPARAAAAARSAGPRARPRAR
jgi:hypothetical protein